MIVVKKDASNNPVTEYYVGTSVGLYSTLNLATGTPVWVREGGNVLNFAVVSSMDYRPQDNTLLVGTHGNGLYYANVGTPDFRPNQNTGVNDPVRNDKKFIKQVYPTIVNRNVISFRTGDLFTIPRVVVKITNLTGQVVYRRDFLYQDAQIDVQVLPKGVYVLTITSPDYKHQHVERFVKE
jgi:hypothetical protein